MSRDSACLLDLIQALRRARGFLGDTTQPDFFSDVKNQSSVIHQLLIAGEAVKRLSSEFRSSHPEIPWNDIAGMRDVLIHRYDEIDLVEVWSTLREDIPELIPALERLAAETAGNE